ncbi:DUF4166 domain-containing protein [Bacillus cihuensis]|uniref:DUF4166 domain-containing protein n=1 Tax=Bacillus cihuensis TaxID=1208599 RepID=UPI000420D4EB|nr:DUF4166 domain-containing protein [Bacillus cihuensis]
MSIYKKVLGNQFNVLHPMLQKRYDISAKKPFQAYGVMKTIKGGPKWLYPFFLLGVNWKLLFPEHGHLIPFSIVNTARIGNNGEEQIHWERIFYFEGKKRFFNAVMSLDHERLVIKDYLGEPSLFYSDLSFHVSQTGEVQIESKDQRLVLGLLEIPVPKFLQGLATVTEAYIEDRKVFSIKVEVRNPLIGLIFAYEGEFTPNERC